MGVSFVIGSLLGSVMVNGLMGSIWEYYVAINFTVLSLAIITLFVIAIATIGCTIRKVVSTNPVDSLRYDWASCYIFVKINHPWWFILKDCCLIIVSNKAAFQIEDDLKSAREADFIRAFVPVNFRNILRVVICFNIGNNSLRQLI